MNPTKISYLTHTWNPVTGCTKGCPECWARDVAQKRLYPAANIRASEWALAGDCGQYESEQKQSSSLAEAYRTFTPTLHPERLDQPFKRKKPAVIGVCFMGDLFDPAISTTRNRVINAVKKAPHHIYVFLTKQPEMMQIYFCDLVPRDNWHLGFSARTQAEFDAGWPHMAKLAAAGWKVWVSLEPLLGPVDIGRAVGSVCAWCGEGSGIRFPTETPFGERIKNGLPLCESCSLEADGPDYGISTVVIGEQSGSVRPPFDMAWVESLVEQCEAAGVPVMVKQLRDERGKMVTLPEVGGKVYDGLAWGVK